MDNFPLRTPDIDFLIPTPFHGKEHTSFITQLEALGFDIDFKSDGSLYLWNAELKIEFITPLESPAIYSWVDSKSLVVSRSKIVNPAGQRAKFERSLKPRSNFLTEFTIPKKIKDAGVTKKYLPRYLMRIRL